MKNGLLMSAISLVAASVSAGSAFGQQLNIDYSQLEKTDREIEKEIQRLYEESSTGEARREVEENLYGPLSAGESRNIDMKIEAIKKRIFEQDYMREHIDALYRSNAQSALEDRIRLELGFTPDQWRQYRKEKMEVDKARNEPIGDVDIRIREETLDNGSVDPVEIMVVRGYATAIVFVDAAGNPWPIEGDITGDSNSYRTNISMSHVAVIDNINEFKESNALVNLQGLNIPVVLSLKSNAEASDSRVIIHLPQLGPNSKDPLVVNTVSDDIEGDIKELLNQGKLSNAVEYGFENIRGSVFLKEGWMYIRSTDELLIPNPIQSATSPTGYRVYKVPASNMFLFSNDKGQKIKATIGKEREVEVQHKSFLRER